MKTSDFRALMRFSPDKIQKHDVISTPRLTTELYCLEAGQVQRSAKYTEADRIYFILEGVGRFSIGRTTREFRAGTAVLAASGEEHGVVNIGEERLVLLVATAPPPEKT